MQCKLTLWRDDMNTLLLGHEISTLERRGPWRRRAYIYGNGGNVPRLRPCCWLRRSPRTGWRRTLPGRACTCWWCWRKTSACRLLSSQLNTLFLHLLVSGYICSILYYADISRIWSWRGDPVPWPSGWARMTLYRSPQSPPPPRQTAFSAWSRWTWPRRRTPPRTGGTAPTQGPSHALESQII